MTILSTELQPHLLAELFPLIEGPQFDALVADIRKHGGLLFPITTYEGQILDGRNRYRACRAANVEPRFESYAGDDPAGFVLSANIARRHLAPEQKRELIKKVLQLKPELFEPADRRADPGQPSIRRQDARGDGAGWSTGNGFQFNRGRRPETTSQKGEAPPGQGQDPDRGDHRSTGTE